ncbi:MAG: hypothetical protein K8I27_07135 [Planctomycetes bacterium]|nr:hypothetical protein [Planctomycetota bacterium]
MFSTSVYGIAASLTLLLLFVGGCEHAASDEVQVSEGDASASNTVIATCAPEHAVKLYQTSPFYAFLSSINQKGEARLVAVNGGESKEVALGNIVSSDDADAAIEMERICAERFVGRLVKVDIEATASGERAYVFLGELLLNAWLIVEGHCFAGTEDSKYLDRMEAAQALQDFRSTPIRLATPLKLRGPFRSVEE